MCMCVCVQTYSVGLQNELNDISWIVVEQSYGGARNQLTVVLKTEAPHETDKVV